MCSTGMFRYVYLDAIINHSQASIQRFFMADTQHSPPVPLLEDVRRVLRLQHYSIHTERSYVEWLRRFARIPPDAVPYRPLARRTEYRKYLMLTEFVVSAS